MFVTYVTNISSSGVGSYRFLCSYLLSTTSSLL